MDNYRVNFAGCSSQSSIGNKAQIEHTDQIMVLGLTHGMTRQQNVNHQVLTIAKPVDKSSRYWEKQSMKMSA
jgi:type VI secretion system Hcp family effector